MDSQCSLVLFNTNLCIFSMLTRLLVVAKGVAKGVARCNGLELRLKNSKLGS